MDSGPSPDMVNGRWAVCLLVVVDARKESDREGCDVFCDAVWTMPHHTVFDSLNYKDSHAQVPEVLIVLKAIR